MGHCCGLKENDSNRLIYFNGWFPIGGTVWEGRGVTLLENH